MDKIQILLIIHHLICIYLFKYCPRHQIQSQMKTRRQIQKEAALKQDQKSKEKKLTKKQLMDQMQQLQNQQTGESIGGKKRKIQNRDQVSKQKEEKIKKVSAKALKKDKQARVKESPKVQKSQQVQKKSLNTQPQVNISSKQKEKKQQVSKNQEPLKRTKNQQIFKKQEQQLPRKKPQIQTKKTQEQKQMVKTLIMKGKAPIDEHSAVKKQDFHVLQMGGKVYSATLNQTNVVNNNNKFYIIQILQKDSNPEVCYLFTRWGRVGFSGQFSEIGPIVRMSAIRQYQSKLHQKTRKGQYREIEMNYEDQQEKKSQKDDKDQKDAAQQQKVKKKESKLSKQVQSLVELIFDINMMNQQMFKIGYNVDKMPLGKLSKQSIKKGYNIIKELYDQIKGEKRHQEIVRLTNEFYSFIPHDFGFQKMTNHILDTQLKVKNKIEMLESLAQIKVATTLINQSKKDEENRLDANYAKLNRNIQPVDRQSTEFKTINQYLHTTHGRHHSSYTLEIVDLFRVQSDMENVRFTKNIHNRKLLWHGSRLTNFVGILSQGLRIAPPEAPVTGYMFGKGVYFADMSSKSANYCFTSRDSNTGILLLCEVALGNMNEKIHADQYAANLPPNKHSTKGVGKIQPDPKNSVELQKDLEIPMGPGVETNDPTLYLRYNQFIVYDIAQVKIRYLLRLKFNYQTSFGGFGF